MGKKSSTTVPVRVVRRKAPGTNLPPLKVSHYGNGWNGRNVKPKPQPAPAAGK
jgi:hypothetical protein